MALYEIKKYNQCKSYKVIFNKNLKEAKILIKSGDFKEAKVKIDENEKIINYLKSIIDSLPNHTATKVLYTIMSLIQGIITSVNSFDIVNGVIETSLRTQISDEDVDYIKDDIRKVSAITVATTGGVATAIKATRLKTFKDKSKKILEKCEKKLEQVKKYLDKAEKMSKAVKESFDDTLNDLYESFYEGNIDEFEYDILIDRLLN